MTPPTTTHRVIALVTAIALLVGLRGMWTEATLHRPVAAISLTLCFAALLALAVLALTGQRQRTLTIVDVGLLVVGLVKGLFGILPRIRHDGFYGSDEGVLVDAAAAALRHGERVYGVDFSGALTQAHAGVTKLMAGGIAEHYGYPPLSAMLAVLTQPIAGPMPAAAVLAGLCVVAASILLFLLAPPDLRSTATLVFLTTGWFITYAWNGYPIVIAMPFLVVAVAGWPMIGAGGRLGRFGVTRAVCLGLAAATQQLTWFFVPFLLIGVFAARRGELRTAASLGIVLRYLAIAVTTFSIINFPFIIQSPGAWASGVLEPITQHAIPIGQGVVGISNYYTDGSGALAYYSHAAMALLLGFVIAMFLFPRRLGPAAMVLPSVCFYLATRSQDNYYILLTPLWLTSVVTLPPDAFARAWQPRPWPLASPAGRRVVAAVLTVPALACLVVAVATPPPLRMVVVSWTSPADRPDFVRQIVMEITNRATHPVRPSFAVSANQGVSAYWVVRQGPVTLAPGAGARYVIESTNEGTELNPDGPTLLRAVSDDPMTMTNTVLARRP